ncbi:tyrosine-type recombinase/integrase [Streptomyces sp. WMMB 322]|uniref:tyrosine-type recombinase/integrase n=1 Tax=Streptomyces sp. WMMB 322 TaxID=1286821 RepID=UPI0006E135AB|nr:tyrosine-type recombinase/integrase [Streptomyces sp. WMMB 322]SCK43563.1 Site-specific recombinase XerD [Streptomyces sp. WMMB 322]
MTKRRSRGDGGLHWDDRRERWVATVSLGHDGRGKRIVKRGSGRTKTEAKAKLRQVIRDYEDGLAIAPASFTVKNAVEDWLAYGLTRVAPVTVEKYTILCQRHVIPALGARKLRDLSADDVDKWLADKARTLSTDTLRVIRSCLNRAVKRAMVRDKVKRNVVELCSIPTGQAGRPSKALTLAQAEAVLDAAADTSMHAYIVVSLLTGARTEELRPLAWEHVDLVGMPDANPPVPPYLAVWRSVRAGGDTKTRKSRRTLALPGRCVEVLTEHRQAQERRRAKAGEEWSERGLVFASEAGTELDAANVRRAFRRVLKAVDGLDPAEWTPRELRHSFVSLLSDSGVPLEEISRLVGHSSTAVTEKVYRKQIRPVIQTGAVVMDRVFENDRVAGPSDTSAVEPNSNP